MDLKKGALQKEVEDYQRFGVNVVEHDFITAMVEKPDEPISRLAQVGLYYLKDGRRFMRSLGDTIATDSHVKGEFYLPAVFMQMIADGCRFRAPEIDAWLDCGKPDTILQTYAYLLQGRHHIHGDTNNCVLIEPVHIEQGAVVRDSIVGPNVSIARGSVIEGCIIRNTIINAKCHVRNMLLNDSILGDEVDLSAAPRRMNIGDHSLIEMQG